MQQLIKLILSWKIEKLKTFHSEMWYGNTACKSKTATILVDFLSFSFSCRDQFSFKWVLYGIERFSYSSLEALSDLEQSQHRSSLGINSNRLNSRLETVIHEVISILQFFSYKFFYVIYCFISLNLFFRSSGTAIMILNLLVDLIWFLILSFIAVEICFSSTVWSVLLLMPEVAVKTVFSTKKQF